MQCNIIYILIVSDKSNKKHIRNINILNRVKPQRIKIYNKPKDADLKYYNLISHKMV